MVWIERTNDRQQSFKTSEMDGRIEWNDNGIARTTEHDAEIAIDLGAARRRESEELEDEDVAEPEPEPEPVPDADELEDEAEAEAEAEHEPPSTEMDGVNE